MIALLALPACGDGGDDSASADDRTSVSWLDTDVCSLVDDADVATLIGPKATTKAGGSGPSRPECAWTVAGTERRLVLRLWQPPVPAALTDGTRRTTAVGPDTGYVEAEDKQSCLMHVEAEPAWLSVDLVVPRDGSRPRLCDAVTPMAEQVLAFVR